MEPAVALDEVLDPLLLAKCRVADPMLPSRLVLGVWQRFALRVLAIDDVVSVNESK